VPESESLAVHEMRGEAERLIRSRVPLSGVELAAVTERMRAHLDVLLPSVQDAALQRPAQDSGRAVALISIGEARRRLDAGPRSLGPEQFAVRLARSVAALCGMSDRLRAAS
jgi:hypothetical protein